MSLVESIERRIETVEKWQRIELIMLGIIIGEKALEYILPLLA